MRYTVEQNGAVWVASNGTDSVEADDPGDALYLLLTGEAIAEQDPDDPAAVEDIARDLTAEESERRVGAHCLTLVRFVAMRTPAVMLRNAVRVIEKNVEEFISLAELEE